ncbi:MAG: homocysteine S-methyltransferase family protein [Erysipelotrichaceae bacterium]|nr:homocysteine S-methyltransferase family protein [Erysipelotrichaceae bacterium]
MLKEKLKNEILIFDGAMGTLLLNKPEIKGIKAEILNQSHPDLIIDIHKQYLLAGADIITTNTFGANPKKFTDPDSSIEVLIPLAIKNAREAIKQADKEAYVALDIGPLGEFLQPAGTLSFEEAYDLFKAQILAGKDEADLILIETITDLYEAKAAILAAKENSELPIIAMMTFNANGRSLTGCTPQTFALLAQAMGVSALGINCSLGPDLLAPMVDELLANTQVPIILEPNAGLPVVKDGKTTYPLQAEEFATIMEKYVNQGVNIIGSCCGSSPDFTKKLAQLKNHPLIKKQGFIPPEDISSPTDTLILADSGVLVVSIVNGSNYQRMAEALKNRDFGFVQDEAMELVDDNTQALHIDLRMMESDQLELLPQAVKALQEVVKLPMILESDDPVALDAACRIYNGKPLIVLTSENGASPKVILSIAKKYGATFFL